VKHILVVDDEESFCDTLRDILEEAQYRVSIAHAAVDALAFVEQNHEALDVILLDIRMPGMSGLDLLPQLAHRFPEIPVIMLTGIGTVDTAVKSMQLGAQNFLEKPPDEERLLQTIDNALKKRGAHRTLTRAGFNLEQMGIIAESAAMKEVLANVETCAASDIPVLITGETGVGKEIIAHSVHQFSKRALKKFIAIDVPNIPATMFESEVFGHAKGAFTGATEEKNGLYHEAHGGTIFLDEIGELPLEMQPKFLRVLQTKEVKKLGSVHFEQIDARVVSATNRDLLTAIREHKMREDLYYRLRGVEIYIPPLRDRREDIPALAKHFLKKAIIRHGLPERIFTDSGLAYLTELSWHGNARELELFVDRAAVFATDDMMDATMLAVQGGAGHGGNASAFTRHAETYTDIAKRTRIASDQVKREELVAILQKCHWNITLASAELGIDRTTLSKQMRRLNIAKPSL